jgi:hypothetical protein
MDDELGNVETAFWWKRDDKADKPACAAQPRAGDLCPVCGKASLDYNGLFVLTCPRCHHVAESGVFS